MTCHGPLNLDNNPSNIFIRHASFSDIKPNKYKYELFKKTQSSTMAFSMYYQHLDINVLFQTQCQGHIIIIKGCQVLSFIKIFSYLFTFYIVHVDIVI